MKYGYTMDGCSRCDHMMVWGNARGYSQAHSRECRQRIAEELSKDPVGQTRLRKVEDRRKDRSGRRPSEGEGAPPGTKLVPLGSASDAPLRSSGDD